MKFYDKVKVEVIAGNGGDGCVSGRREKYIAYGGPDGGDGGKGGSIYFVGDEGETSLLDLHYKKQIKARRGEHGKGSQQYGENAEDIFIKVPVGTIIKDINTNEILGIITKHGEKILVAKGGRGGFGNIHFATPTRQFPNFAMKGEPGEKRTIQAELQLIGDVTLIGYPSVGKSSIINTLANTKAKVADYPFTTLIPNLGVIKHKNKNFVMVDVPGLIKGAAKGKGLGNDFLRHILKSKIWTFVLDISRFEESFKELKNLKQELESFIKKKGLEFLGNEFTNLKFKYIGENNAIKLQVFSNNKLLFEKYLLFLVNKTDLINDEEIIQEYIKQLKTHIKNLFGVETEIFLVNAGNKKAFEKFLDKIIELLEKPLNQDAILNDYLLPKAANITRKRPENYIKNITDEELKKLIEEGYIEEDKAENIQVWEVYNPKLAYYVWIIPWGNKEAELFFYEVMKHEGISSWLENNGVYPGDIIKVTSPYPGYEDKYILWGLE